MYFESVVHMRTGRRHVARDIILCGPLKSNQIEENFYKFYVQQHLQACEKL